MIVRTKQPSGRRPICGVDFCDDCGDCLACYQDEECAASDDGHSWVIRVQEEDYDV